MGSWLRVGLLLGGLAAVPGMAGAQIELAAASTWVSPGGEDFEDTDAGAGFEAVARIWVGSHLTLGLGGGWSGHDVDFADDDYDIVTVFAEPRWVVGAEGAPLRPFVAARLGWAREAIRQNGRDRAATGVGAGLLLGAVVRVSRHGAVEGGVGAYRLSFGDFERDGTTLELPGGSGRALVVRLGVNVGM